MSISRSEIRKAVQVPISIVRWQAGKAVTLPIIECLMVGSPWRTFVRPGQAVRKDTK